MIASVLCVDIQCLSSRMMARISRSALIQPRRDLSEPVQALSLHAPLYFVRGRIAELGISSPKPLFASPLQDAARGAQSGTGIFVISNR